MKKYMLILAVGVGSLLPSGATRADDLVIKVHGGKKGTTDELLVKEVRFKFDDEEDQIRLAFSSGPLRYEMNVLPYSTVSGVKLLRVTIRNVSRNSDFRQGDEDVVAEVAGLYPRRSRFGVNDSFNGQDTYRFGISIAAKE
jgi:hypothetical protein